MSSKLKFAIISFSIDNIPGTAKFCRHNVYRNLFFILLIDENGLSPEQFVTDIVRTIFRHVSIFLNVCGTCISLMSLSCLDIFFNIWWEDIKLRNWNHYSAKFLRSKASSFSYIGCEVLIWLLISFQSGFSLNKNSNCFFNSTFATFRCGFSSSSVDHKWRNFKL